MVTSDEPEMDGDTVPVARRSRGRAGRPRTHGYRVLRRTLQALTTKRLDGRSAVAVAVRAFKAQVTEDLGGNLSRAQEVVLESAAQKLVLRDTLADYIFRQPSLVTRKRQLVPVVLHFLQVSESLARDLERLGLEKRAKALPSLADYVKSYRAGDTTT